MPSWSIAKYRTDGALIVAPVALALAPLLILTAFAAPLNYSNATIITGIIKVPLTGIF